MVQNYLYQTKILWPKHIFDLYIDDRRKGHQNKKTLIIHGHFFEILAIVQGRCRFRCGQNNDLDLGVTYLVNFFWRRRRNQAQYIYQTEKPFKGQLISKAIYGLLTSPKKRMDKFVLFVFLLFMANKSNWSVHFLGEFMARQSAFRFHLTFTSNSK